MSTRTRIKFCGITRVEDALAAAALGVDALGFVFTRRSRRFVEPVAAARIRAVLPPFVATVALFMDDAPEWIEAVLGALHPDLLQFHGSERADHCTGFGLPYLKAVPMASIGDVASYATAHPAAGGLLLDAHAVGEPGGAGMAFDWSRVPPLRRPLIVAGGLDAGNAGEAVRRLRPYGLDVSSGIEQAPGIKDAARMRAFVAAVREADREVDRALASHTDV